MSIIFDVKESIRAADKIGRSKMNYRKREKKHYIHSHKTKTEVEKISYQFVNYCRDTLGVNKLHKIEEKHFLAFMKTKENLSLGYQRNIETNLRIMQRGFLDRSEKLNKTATPFCTNGRITESMSRNEGVYDCSLPIRDIQAIKEQASENGQKALDLMHNLGFRVSGATSVTAGDVKWHENVVGVTEKGGRYREVPIPQGFREGLANMTKDKEPHERLVPVKSGTIRDDLREASKKAKIWTYTGTHSFRHSYARERVEKDMSVEEKRLMDKCLENYANGREFDYAIHENRKVLYHSMTLKIDGIHKDLGHGNGRYDLALRYMRM